MASDDAKELDLTCRPSRRTIIMAAAALQAICSGTPVFAAAATTPARYAFDTAGVTELRLQLRSDDVLVQGVDGTSVTVRTRDAAAAMPAGLRADWQRTGNRARIDVHGGPSHDVGLVVEVPRMLSIRVGMFAGQLDIYGMLASIDAHVQMGDVEIGMTDSAAYSAVEGSVTSGAITCPSLDVDKGGLFRSFRWAGTGKYILRARVVFGSLAFDTPSARE
jgi:hypothetical protein